MYEKDIVCHTVSWKKGLSLSDYLKKQAQSVFELDNLSWRILSCIAEKGPLSEYDINNEIPDVSRSPIRLRIFGSKKRKGLLDRDFIQLVEVESIAPKLESQKKKFGLSFKGLLASVKLVPLRRNFLFNDMRPFDDVDDVAIWFAESEIALWFQYYIENGMMLTDMKNAYYSFSGERDRFDSTLVSRDLGSKVEKEQVDDIWVSELVPSDGSVFSSNWDLLKHLRSRILDVGSDMFKDKEEGKEVLLAWPIMSFYDEDREWYV